jgi:two-component system response regulator NreC
MPTRILIADDHGVLRAGLHALLSAEPEMEVVGEAADGKEALRKTETLQPDVVLLDLSMGEVGGIEVARQLCQVHPEVRVLILTVHEDKELLQEAVKVGASGYILKKASKSELISAIQSALRGELYIHPSLTRSLMAHPQIVHKKHETPEIVLTDRETEVLKWIARGYTNAQISKQLIISIRTVEYHRSNLMDKLGFSTRDQLVAYAVQQKLI